MEAAAVWRMWRPVPEDEGRRPDDGRARLEAGVGLALADRALATASSLTPPPPSTETGTVVV